MTFQAVIKLAADAASLRDYPKIVTLATQGGLLQEGFGTCRGVPRGRPGTDDGRAGRCPAVPRPCH